MEEQKIGRKKWKKEKGATFIPAGLFLGFGIGLLINNMPAGLFIGLGVGFFAYAMSLFFEK